MGTKPLLKHRHKEGQKQKTEKEHYKNPPLIQPIPYTQGNARRICNWLCTEDKITTTKHKHNSRYKPKH